MRSLFARWESAGLTCVVTLCATLSACGFAGDVRQGAPPATTSLGAAARKAGAPANGRAQQAAHVFVLDSRANALFRFPIQNGIVAQQPDSTLTIATNAAGLAIGPDGTQYVSDYNGDVIDVYAPGASGNDKPTRTIAVNPHPLSLTRDQNGYLFARLTDDGGRSTVAVIAPGGGVVNEIVEPNASTLAVDSQGNLYVGSDAAIDVYGTPETNPTLVRSSCLRPVRPLFDIAVSERGTLFVAKRTIIGVVNDTVDACPLPGYRRISLAISPPFFGPAITAAGGRLFTVEGLSHPRLLELNAAAGRQVPLADVVWSGFVNPYAVATGP